MKGKESHHFRPMHILKAFQFQKKMGSKIQISLIQANIRTNCLQSWL